MSEDCATQYLALARGYAEAAARVLETGFVGAERLVCFAMIAHGMELAMKAVLARQGWGEERLMMIGHDLAHCRDAVARSRAAFAAALDGTFADCVDRLSYPHAAQSLRYPQPQGWELPDAAVALQSLRRFIDAADRADTPRA